MRWGLVVVLAGCHAGLGDDPGAVGDAGRTDSGTQLAGDGSAGTDAGLGVFTTPVAITVANTAASEDDSTMSWGGGELVFARVNGSGNKQLMSMTYTGGVFSAPALLSFSGAVDDESPRFSTDDLTLYFSSSRGGASLDIYQAHRATVGGAWSTPVKVAGPNTATTDKWYAPCEGGRYLVVSSNGTDTELYEGVVGATPALATLLDSASNETGSYLSKDCLTAYFASDRGGDWDLYTSSRTTLDTPWSTPVKVAPFDTADNEEDPWISPDLKTFTFARASAATPGQKDLYISTRP